LTEASDGFAIFRWKYDEGGQRTEAATYGVDDHLKGKKTNGIAVIRWEYDEEGNVFGITTYDTAMTILSSQDASQMAPSLETFRPSQN